MIVHIDEYGELVKPHKKKHTIKLTGSWSYAIDCYKYEVKEVYPTMPIPFIYSNDLLKCAVCDRESCGCKIQK